MKKSILFTLIFSMLLWSCGSSEESETDSENTTNEEQTGEFTASGGLVKANLPEGWTKDGKGENGFKIYSYLLDEGTDIHKAIKHDYGFPDIDEVKEVTVDGLPALTLKEKMMQNEAMICRAWLVYTGSKIVNITVQSPEAAWDDAVAEKVISTVKITERESSVELPKPAENPIFIKPDEFPEEVLAMFESDFSETPTLTAEVIENSLKTNTAIKETVKNNSDLSNDNKTLLIDSLAKAQGFESVEAYIKVPAVAESCFKIINAYNDLKDMDKGGQEYKMSHSIVSSVISQVGVAKDDVRFVYDNWELSKQCVNEILEK